MRTLALLAAGLLALPAAPSEFRHARTVSAPAGWVRLELPDDVLDACRPGLPDLRLFDESGREVPFAFEDSIRSAQRRLPIENLASVEKVETIGEIDRGPNPGFGDGLTFEVAGTDFLKPVRIEGSDDRTAWKEIARGSIFAAGGARRLTLPMPRTDRRYVRFRLDDRNGDPIRPDSVVVRSDPAASPAGERPVALRAAPGASGERGRAARYEASLPAANLNVDAIRFAAKDPAFSRRVRVFERVLFRDEICRRLVAEGTISRTPGGPEVLDVAVDGLVGRPLDIEIDGEDSPPLQDLTAAVLVRPTVLRFHAPEAGSVRLLYGSRRAAAPDYDLARSLAGTPSDALPIAGIGPASDTGAMDHEPAAEVRAPLADAGQWSSRRSIRLPAGGGVAYLDLYDAPGGLGDLRIVDESGRQVPFIVERGVHEHRETVTVTDASAGPLTVIRIPTPAHADAIDEVELRAAGPDYFLREVRVEEERRDARGPIPDRLLGTARWERRPGDPSASVRIPIERPGPASGLRVEIDNGGNPPVRIAEVALKRASVRVDFLYRAGDRLSLYSGNPDARLPAYDLDLISGSILSSPAQAADLGDVPPAEGARASLGVWVWAAVGVTVCVLVFELARALPRRV